ncbi:MAG: aminotransferase class V-fold PLP-dependent enzyme [Gemmatimonadetes bacterium]|nr:aminotransferase class V-fold PLP-dependent enzyme [Gemmatimonadota bacterium]MBI3567249.1 aminotransferase class V-fold PLP-dependent enzyme [Gemmatimonadota bacterium]
MMRENAFAQIFKANAIAGDRAPQDVAEDELYWAQIQRAFDADRTMINLNNGGVCPTPTHVLEQLFRDLRFTNELPVEHMWRVLEPRMESTRRDLAREFGCDPEEMAVVRNASEANEIMIFGLDLKRGDEVVVTNQNYPRMITSWQQRERREGIVLKQVSFKVPPPSDDYIVEQFRQAITPRTKVIEVTHITNLTGQIMPVRKLVDMARPLGIEVFVDGAHAFSHFPFKRDELDCDYYGTSLHKWTLAPIGTGFLYVRQAKIPQLWSLMGSGEGNRANIRKYEEIGTHPQANFNAVSAALAFSRGIGAERKIARLRYLRNRWANRLLAESDRVQVLTPLTGERSGAICMFDVKGMDPGKLGGWLLDKYKIVTTPIVHPEFHGIRITPNVYTSVDEIDTFGDAVTKAIKKGIA